MKRIATLLLLLAVLAAFGSALGYGPVVLNREGEQRIALLLGAPTVITQPGISFALSTARMRPMERRWLHLSSKPRAIQTRDGESLTVDNYIIWRIKNPLAFREAYRNEMAEAERQIDRTARAAMLDVLGGLSVREVVDSRRTSAMAEITRLAAAALAPRGIEILDVRLNRTELPPGNEQNVHARMRSERERLARKYRAEGEEEARRIRAAAKREARVLVARGARQAQVIKGEGDAVAARIYADAYGADPEFYEFTRSLEAYKKTVGEGGATMVLSPSHQFFRVLQSGGDAE